MAASVATFSGRSIIWNRMKGSGTEPVFQGWGTSSSVSNSANPNVNLFQPATESRATGTSSLASTTQLADTYKVIATQTCAGAAKTITEMGLFDASALSLTSTLSASLTAAATTMTLGANVGPTAGSYYAQVENETILVTGANSTTLTIARGQLGSTSATHVAGAAVTSGGDGGAGAGAGSGQTTLPTGGSMFCHADFSGIALNTNDSITATWTDTLT